MAADDSTTQLTLFDAGEPAKSCCRCGETKPLTDFHRKRGRRNKDAICKACRVRLMQEVRATPEGRARMDFLVWRQRLRSLYKIEPADFERMLAEQGGVCAICGKTESARKPGRKEIRLLSVDHDHATGAIRALLCAVCNQGLGLFQHDPNLLRLAALYLEKHA